MIETIMPDEAATTILSISCGFGLLSYSAWKMKIGRFAIAKHKKKKSETRQQNYKKKKISSVQIKQSEMKINKYKQSLNTINKTASNDLKL